MHTREHVPACDGWRRPGRGHVAVQLIENGFKDEAGRGSFDAIYVGMRELQRLPNAREGIEVRTQPRRHACTAPQVHPAGSHSHAQAEGKKRRGKPN